MRKKRSGSEYRVRGIVWHGIQLLEHHEADVECSRSNMKLIVKCDLEAIVKSDAFDVHAFARVRVKNVLRAGASKLLAEITISNLP